MTPSNYMDVEDLEVYKKLCRLHIEAESSRARTPLAVGRGLSSVLAQMMNRSLKAGPLLLNSLPVS